MPYEGQPALGLMSGALNISTPVFLLPCFAMGETKSQGMRLASLADFSSPPLPYMPSPSRLFSMDPLPWASSILERAIRVSELHASPG